VFNSDYSKSDVLNEALNQARVETTGLNIPKILEVTQTSLGEWVIVSEFIEGKTLQQLIDENPDDKAKYMEMFVRLQIDVCKHRCTLLTKLKDKMTNKIELANIDSAVKYELRTRLEGITRQNQLCHGDFNPSNVVLKEDGTMYILDWAHATQGAPCADAARTYLTYCLDNDFETAKEYLEMYCSISEIPIKNIQRWLPIVAASQSVKNIKEERELLLSWINVSDFE
jgi:thiamine kinase-like enzyme